MTTTNARDLVLSYLRQEKVQLWLPPYTNDDAGAASLRCLAEKVSNHLSASSEVPPNYVDDIFSILSQLQSHALEKLKKHSVDIKVLATHKHFASLPENDASLPFSSWGDSVTAVSNGDVKKSLIIRVENISSSLTVDKLSSELCCALDATSSRVIYKGRNLSVDNQGNNNVRKIVSSTNDGKEEQRRNNEILCIVSGHGYIAPVAAAATAVSELPITTDKDTIDSIRASARRIAYNKSRFEITDQKGNLVPMSQTDSISLLTALGLHRIGRSKMEKSREALQSEDRNSLSSALTFFLEADAEWQSSSALESWKYRVDNYGLLQLDIVWCFLRLGCLDNLTDAVRRLEIAEVVLRKQVHKNFVTLALVNAEANNPIPPLCTVFVRLFLLQGVANKMRNCNDTAKKRLEWARVMCQQLQSCCPQDRVDLLSDAYYVEPATAISALRKFNGDPDAAGNFIASVRNDEVQSAKKRKRQHRLGKCSNNIDFVNLDLVQKLNDLLGYSDINVQDDGQADYSTSMMITISLLRLTDNDIEKSFSLYNEIGAQEVLQRAQQLDRDIGFQRTDQKRTEHNVSDVDIATLVSMGVDEANGRNALRSTGNVDQALLWLTKADANGGVLKQDSTNNSEIASSSSSSSSDDEDSPSDENDNAYDFLERELGHALSSNSKDLLEKEWLGVDLKEEWKLIEEYYNN